MEILLGCWTPMEGFLLGCENFKGVSSVRQIKYCKVSEWCKD